MRLAAQQRIAASRYPSARGSSESNGHLVIPERLLRSKVLVVEDETMIAWLLEATLSDLGFENISVVSTGEEAVDEAAAAPLGLVISDINLGPRGMDGIEAAVSICTAAPVPVVFISGYVGGDNSLRIRDQLAQAAILRKPVTVDELVMAITDVFTTPRTN